MTAIRPWCGVARYPGLTEFQFGTITMPKDAQSHEIEAALTAHALTMLPPGFDLLDIRCGAIFFHPED